MCRSAENDSSPERAAGRPAGGGVAVGQEAWASVGEQHRLGVASASRSEDYYVEGLSLK